MLWYLHAVSRKSRLILHALLRFSRRQLNGSASSRY